MTSPKLSIVTWPSEQPLSAAKPESFLRGEALLAQRLSRAVHADVPVMEGFLRDAPSDGFILAYQAGDIEAALADCPAERRTEIALRTVDFDTKWPALYKTLERYRLAAAVDIFHRWQWESHPDNDTGSGIFGLIAVAERAGMTYESGRRFGSEHYGVLSCRDHCRDLPGLLLHYLTVYEEMGFHKPGQAQ